MVDANSKDQQIVPESSSKQRREADIVEGFSRANLPETTDVRSSQPNPIMSAKSFIAHHILNAVQNRRLLILQPFALILGILLYRSTTFEPAYFAIIGVWIVASTALFVWRASPILFPVFALVCGVCFGFSLLPIHGGLYGTEMVYGSIYGEFSAQVDAIHSNDAERARIILSNLEPLDQTRLPDIRRARIIIPANQLPKVGDVVRANLRLYRVPGPVTPGGFDSQFHAYFDGIGAFGSATSELIVSSTSQKISFARGIQDVRDFVGARIDLSLSPPISGIARALIVGDQGQVDGAIRANLAAAGLAHVLAISGLHLSLVAGGVFAAIRLALASSYFLGQRFAVKKIAAVGGMAAAIFYLGLSGASVSAVRATLMLVLVFGAVIAGRRALTMRNVAIAALFVIIMDPASIFRPSFQLSFAAVVALVGAYEGYRPQKFGPNGGLQKVMGFAGGIALTSLIAGAATALFAAYHFQQVAPFGVLGNMVAIPLVSFVVLPFALLGVMLIPFGLEQFVFGIMGWGIESIIQVAEVVSDLSADLFAAPILGAQALIIGLAVLAWFAFFPHAIRFLGIGLAAICLPLWGTMPPPDVLIADTTQALALRDQENFELVAGKQGSFAVRVWTETYMQPIVSPVKTGPCDGAGCFFENEIFSLALIKTREAFEEDCAIAQLVVARIDAPEFCKMQTQTIDKTDLQIHGVHWAKWTGKGFWIRPAITDIYRPWRPPYPSLGQ